MDLDAAAATAAEEVQAQADFDSGMPDAPPAKPSAKPDAPAKPEAAAAATPKPAAAAPAVVKPAPPEYVRLTKDEHTTLTAAAAKTASFETQLSRAFGSIGDLTKKLTALQTATPRGLKVEIPKDAFAGMERDFPELAQHTRAALEATLRGLTGTGPANAEIDPELMKRLVTEHATEARVAAEIEALGDDHPDWRKIVGQVDISKQQPDPANPFRKWLATKDAAYQARLNGTNSAAVISRAISRFQSETKATAPAPPTLKQQLQTARIRDAVQPRGDGGQAAPTRTDDDDFAAGFASG